MIRDSLRYTKNALGRGTSTIVTIQDVQIYGSRTIINFKVVSSTTNQWSR